MVYRVYVEKKAALANEARALLEDLRAFLGIESLTGLRLFNRYDLEGISRELFDYTVKTVLSEPQLDIVTDALPQGDAVFAVEYLPGQYDQRADSAAQCVQILSQGERPLVRTARVYARGQADRCRDRRDQAVCHQPRREPRGISGAAGDAAHGV